VSTDDVVSVGSEELPPPHAMSVHAATIIKVEHRGRNTITRHLKAIESGEDADLGLLRQLKALFSLKIQGHAMVLVNPN
jgi:hypothetical protein